MIIATIDDIRQYLFQIVRRSWVPLGSRELYMVAALDFVHKKIKSSPSGFYVL